MTKFLSDLRIGGRLPVLGILAFSGCSVNAVASLLLEHAAHPTAALWLAAALIEVMTAWLVYQVVEQARKVTRSNISRQDRRFYGLVLAAFAVLVVPSLSLSVWANALEFGSLALGFVFPVLTVGCAVGVALPVTVARHEKALEAARAEVKRKRAETRAERDRKGAEARQQRAEAEAEAARKEAEALRQRLEADRQRLEGTLESLGSAAETLRRYLETPRATQAEMAATLGTSERTIRNHLGRLEDLGIVKRNGQGVELLVSLPESWASGNGNGRH
jgi:Skp family chaperone for outer membrane proteins